MICFRKLELVSQLQKAYEQVQNCIFLLNFFAETRLLKRVRNIKVKLVKAKYNMNLFLQSFAKVYFQY